VTPAPWQGGGTHGSSGHEAPCPPHPPAAPVLSVHSSVPSAPQLRCSPGSLVSSRALCAPQCVSPPPSSQYTPLPPSAHRAPVLHVFPLVLPCPSQYTPHKSSHYTSALQTMLARVPYCLPVFPVYPTVPSATHPTSALEGPLCSPVPTSTPSTLQCPHVIPRPCLFSLVFPRALCAPQCPPVLPVHPNVPQCSQGNSSPSTPPFLQCPLVFPGHQYSKYLPVPPLHSSAPKHPRSAP